MIEYSRSYGKNLSYADTNRFRFNGFEVSSQQIAPRGNFQSIS